MDFISIAIYVAVAALGWWARQKGVLAPKAPVPFFPPVQAGPDVTTQPVVPEGHRVTFAVPFEITLTPVPKEK